MVNAPSELDASGWFAKKTSVARPFWGKGNETPQADWFCVGLTRFEARLCLVSNPRQTGKEWGVIF
ncbi:MAG: hypothetical protein LBU11_02995 [Zoogloeaceae bacterium]|jgi:hypothetical protein|nr:hypothetical protein [Zoogloeaceae bacterium]